MLNQKPVQQNWFLDTYGSHLTRPFARFLKVVNKTFPNLNGPAAAAGPSQPSSFIAGQPPWLQHHCYFYYDYTLTIIHSHTLYDKKFHHFFIIKFLPDFFNWMCPESCECRCRRGGEWNTAELLTGSEVREMSFSIENNILEVEEEDNTPLCQNTDFFIVTIKYTLKYFVNLFYTCNEMNSRVLVERKSTYHILCTYLDISSVKLHPHICTLALTVV